ncbi:MAG: hypothetical protein K940chlam5_01182 [Candidatus Anoxychlamydiales bacterium]|nr:hypothetical protein [Candidatus Anoxychlamydiales bacterium]
MSIGIVNEALAWKNLENFSRYTEDQTPSLSSTNHLSDPTSFGRRFSIFFHDTNIPHVLDTLNTSIEGIRYYYSMHSKERVSSERVEILRNTVSNLKKLAAKVQARDLIQVGLEERKIERKGNNDLFLEYSNMIDTLNNSFDIVDF